MTMTAEDKEFALKIIKHFSDLYKQRTKAIERLSEVIADKQLKMYVSRNYTEDRLHDI